MHRAAALCLSQLRLALWEGVEEVGDEAIVGDLEDGCVSVLIDRDDRLRILHARTTAGNQEDLHLKSGANRPGAQTDPRARAAARAG